MMIWSICSGSSGLTRSGERSAQFRMASKTSAFELSAGRSAEPITILVEAGSGREQVAGARPGSLAARLYQATCMRPSTRAVPGVVSDSSASSPSVLGSCRLPSDGRLRVCFRQPRNPRTLTWPAAVTKIFVGLDVAMDDTPWHAPLPERLRSESRFPVFFGFYRIYSDDAGQGLSLRIPWPGKAFLPASPDFVDDADVRMVEGSSGTRFHHEPCRACGCRIRSGGRNFDATTPPECFPVGLKTTPVPRCQGLPGFFPLMMAPERTRRFGHTCFAGSGRVASRVFGRKPWRPLSIAGDSMKFSASCSRSEQASDFPAKQVHLRRGLLDERSTPGWIEIDGRVIDCFDLCRQRSGFISDPSSHNIAMSLPVSSRAGSSPEKLSTPPRSLRR